MYISIPYIHTHVYPDSHAGSMDIVVDSKFYGEWWLERWFYHILFTIQTLPITSVWKLPPWFLWNAFQKFHHGHQNRCTLYCWLALVSHSMGMEETWSKVAAVAEFLGVDERTDVGPMHSLSWASMWHHWLIFNYSVEKEGTGWGGIVNRRQAPGIWLRFI